MTNFRKEFKHYVKTLNNKLFNDEKSTNTIESYNRVYSQFLEFSKHYFKNLTFLNIKEDDIYEFLDYKSEIMNKQGKISTSTKNTTISALKRLFKHVERNSDEGYDFDKVFEDIKIKQPNRVPKGINGEDVKKLLQYLESLKTKETFTNFRNIFLLKICLFGGLRAFEAISIKVSNIEYQSKERLFKLSFKGKGGKNRVTYIQAEKIEDELSMLVDEFKIDKDTPIAITSTGKQMDRIQLYKMINSIYKQASVKAKGVHILRHTAAKRLIASGVSIIVVKELLGHNSIQTTTIYSNPTESIIKGELVGAMDSRQLPNR